jgi:Raf kinase inhibitor-like YbhB/YbcL family protein
MVFSVKTEAFKDQGMIPRKYTGEGEDISPDLQWNDPPQGTKSFALVCSDPDAPHGTWIHWVLYDIPEQVRSLPEKNANVAVLSNGMKHGINDFGKIGYGGPMPPPGKPHRYFFTVYALDCVLNLPAGQSVKDVEKAMSGHILASAEIMGLYRR